MGGFTSKAFDAMLDEHEEEEVCPTPIMKNKHLFSEGLDPRSPSQQFNRTPIQLGPAINDQFLDPRSPTVGIARTPIYGVAAVSHIAPVILQEECDPRSPTVGITRTPIHGLQAKSGEGDSTSTVPCAADPRSPTADVKRTPVSNKSEKPEIASIEVKPISFNLDDIEPLGDSDDKQEVETTEDADIKPQSEANKDTEEKEVSLKEVETKDAAKEENTEPIPQATSDAAPKEVKKKPRTLFPAEPKGTPKSESKKRHTSQSKENSPRSPFKVIGDNQNQRSPLGLRNMDVDSPRAIVQRKQTNKLGMYKIQGVNNMQMKVMMKSSPKKYQVFHDDKENMESFTE